MKQIIWSMFVLNLGSQKHLQTNKNTTGWRLCGIFHIDKKNMNFWIEGTFTLASSVQEVPVSFQRNDLQSLRKALVYL